MRIIVADTSPLRYLVQIDQIETLASIVREGVRPLCGVRRTASPFRARGGPKVDELEAWLEVSVAGGSDDPSLRALDQGEKAAIALGLSLAAGLILIDDRRSAAVARHKGFEVTGTLGILDLGARRRMVDLADALARLLTTNFRRREELLDALLRQHRKRDEP